jgi:hypothetical protein
MMMRKMRWRQRYEDEMLDLVVRSPLRWRDLLDLLRSAADEWERHLARARWGPAKIAAAAYVVLVVVWGLTGVAANLFAMTMPGPRWGSGVDFGFLAAIPAIAVVFMMPFFLTGLMVSLPVLTLLRVARNRVSVPVARFTAAASLVMWAEWMLFLMEWFDVWRYGIPGARYWVTTVLPWGLAFASAGAVVGSALVRDPNGDPAVNGQRR